MKTTMKTTLAEAVSVKGVVHKKGEEIKLLFSGIFRGNEGLLG